MRIGIDCRIFGSGFTGIGRYTHELIQHFIKFNSKLPVPHQLVLFFNDPQYEEFHPVHNVKKVLVKAKHYSIAEQTTFLFALYKEKCDIVHFPHFNIPLLYRRPYITTIHDLTLSFFPGRKMTKKHHRFAYNLTIKNATRKAKRIIAVSEHTKKDIVKHLNVPSKKIEMIHNGIDKKFRVITDKSKLNSTLKKHNIKKNFLLYTGVWRNHKNLTRLIEAFKILKTEKNLDIQLVITGKPDPTYPETQNKVKELGLQKDVVFPGMVSEKDLINLYNSATIFVFPSLYEGFGLPILEAMSCGTPVSASDISSIPEVCGEENAVLFDPKSSTDIAEKILKLYKDKELQETLIKRGLKRASEFSWKKTAEKTFKILTNV